MIKACLFDLDGTLLPMDLDTFTHAYFKALTPHVATIIPPDKFAPLLWKATMTMVESDEGHLTNEEVFKREFLKLSGLTEEQVWPLFERFYAEEFPKLQNSAGFDPLSREVVQTALDKGYKVAIATNPLFPKVAILERLRWAGVADLPVEWITVFEETHYCKPRLEYYHEVVQQLGVTSEECIMIGNDMQEDMVASTIGMKTFYLAPHYIDRGEPRYDYDQAGTMGDVLNALRTETGVFAK